MGLQLSLTLLLKHCFCQGGKFGHFEHLLYKHNLHRKVIIFLFVLLKLNMPVKPQYTGGTGNIRFHSNTSVMMVIQSLRS